MPEDYNTWVQKAMTISGRLEGLSRAAPAQTTHYNPPAQKLRSNGYDADGDTAITGVNAISGAKPRQRAKWVTEEERTRRRENGLCLRYGRKDYRVNRCPLAPALKPSNISYTATEDLIDLEEKE